MPQRVLEIEETRCSECPLDCAMHVRNKVPTQITYIGNQPGLDVLIIGSAPGRQENDYGLPFVGIGGQLLRKVTGMLAKSLNLNMAFSNIVRCRPVDELGENRPPSDEELKNCFQYVLDDIDRLQPRMIILVGVSALRAFEPSETSRVSHERGVFREIEVNGKKYPAMVTYQPIAAAHNPGLLGILINDISRAFRRVAGKGPDGSYSKVGTDHVISSLGELRKFVDHCLHELPQGSVIACDVETTGLGRVSNQILSIQFAYDGDVGYVILLRHPETPWIGNEYSLVCKELKRLFTTEGNFDAWLMHNAKFDRTQILMQLGIAITNAPIRDTYSAAFLLDENRLGQRAYMPKGTTPYGLKTLAPELLEFEHYKKVNDALDARGKGNMIDLELKKFVEYSGMDAYVTHRLYTRIMEIADRQQYRVKLNKLLDHLFSPATDVIVSMETNGFMIDMDHLRLLRSSASPIKKRMVEITADLRKSPKVKETNERLISNRLQGMKTLFGSPWVFDHKKRSHMITLCLDILGLEPLEFGKTGPKLDKAFLKHYEDKNKEVGSILEFRELFKLDTSYTNNIYKYVHPDKGSEDCRDGRIRPSFHLHRTVTGRGASSHPNLQQVPRGDNPAKRAIKNMFVAAPNTALVQLDYSANEVRWLCIISGDENLAEAFLNGKKYWDAYRANPEDNHLREKAVLYGDIHKNTASGFYGVPVEEVDKAMRNAAKAIVFGLIYGRSIPSIAAQIGKSMKQTERLCKAFFAKYYKASQWLEDIEKHAKKKLYVESPIGRRRRLLSYLLGDKKLAMEANRQARNSPIQSVASDCCWIGASLLNEYIRKNGRDWMIENVVHDSCVAQIPINEIQEYIAVAEHHMVTEAMGYMTEHWDIDFKCPLMIDFDIGTRWGELEAWNYNPRTLDEMVEEIRKAA